MRAQVTLIPAESKKLIAKAVVKLDEVQDAFKNHRILIALGSSTIFIVEELVGKLPDISSEVWIRGLVTPKGTCSVKKVTEWQIAREGEGGVHASEFPFMWLFERGDLKRGTPLNKILEQMKLRDLYIKGVNAIDPSGRVGILTEDRFRGGTSGYVFSRQREVGFKTIFPVGLEKMIPTPIAEAAKEVEPSAVLDYSMGRHVGLLTADGIVITEPKAIDILTGARAVPISAGGLAGAEGAITMVVSGIDEQVTKAINYIEGVKGTKLPELRLRECKNCTRVGCVLKGDNKPWC